MAESHKRALVIGLTGGIASGKTAAADRFAAKGVQIFDADVIARQVVEPGEPALLAVIERFGPDVLSADGQLDRAKLRTRVFADPTARKDLEALLHPRIRERMESLIRTCDTPYCIAAIPLLVEAGQRDLVDRILVVDVPESLQLSRVMGRDGGSEANAQAILRSQASREQRLAVADFVISNDASLQALERQVEHLHERFLLISRDWRASPTDTPLPATPK